MFRRFKYLQGVRVCVGVGVRVRVRIAMMRMTRERRHGSEDRTYLLRP
jgi:hypothetical protein